MERLFAHVSLLSVFAVGFLGLLSVAFYRLYLHPLARFPGPKLAALTRYYEGYWDLYHNGQYTFKIAELHKRYGPIIRISPYELHVSDPTFFDALYRQDAHYDKYWWASEAFGSDGAALTTANHDVHKARRQPMNPYFSKVKVASQQDLVRRHMDRLFARLEAFVAPKRIFNFGAATTAFVRDVTNEFVLGKNYNSLGREDFDVAQLATSQGSGAVWRLTKFFRFVGPTVQALPPSLLLKISHGPFREFVLFLQEYQNDARKLVTAAETGGKGFSDKRTLVNEIIDSKLPASEKAWKRVLKDLMTVTGAGFETTASVLRLICFHVYSNEKMLRQLRAELTNAGASSGKAPELKVLEQLPYLSAIIHEGLRLSPAIATRMARISRKDDIVYKEFRIPAGTPVGMTLILMHTDETLFPDPQKFNPERWLDADGGLKKNVPGFAPFGKGTRMCIGMNLAWIEIYMLLANLVQRFDFDFASNTAEDFRCNSDQFAIGTRGEGHMDATVSYYTVTD